MFINIKQTSPLDKNSKLRILSKVDPSPSRNQKEKVKK